MNIEQIESKFKKSNSLTLFSKSEVSVLLYTMEKIRNISGTEYQPHYLDLNIIKLNRIREILKGDK